MKVSVLGVGYVGLVTGTCLAELGNDVCCMDVDQAKVQRLQAGQIPIYEPGLSELVERNQRAGRLRFTSDSAAAVTHGDLIFIAVGTPSDEDGSADLQYVLAAARGIGRHMDGFKVVVNKSTVPVGTAERVALAVREGLAEVGVDAEFSVASNPEFLKEGAAIEDFMRPDRVVIGTAADPQGERARAMLHELYVPLMRNHDRSLYMDVRSAEFTKYAANAMLATRISFMNELANLADEVSVDIEQVRRGIGSDPRIGYHFLYPGTGYGGSCFPKDVQALLRTGAGHGQRLQVLEAVEAVNQAQKSVLVRKIVRRLGEDLSGRVFAVWGLAFKPNTDDMREAPSRTVIAQLLARGARLRLHDPVAMDEARRVLALDFADQAHKLDALDWLDEPMQALDGADALVILTEWKAFRSPNFEEMAGRLKTPLIFDGRNLYEPSLRQRGFEYHAVGR